MHCHACPRTQERISARSGSGSGSVVRLRPAPVLARWECMLHQTCPPPSLRTNETLLARIHPHICSTNQVDNSPPGLRPQSGLLYPTRGVHCTVGIKGCQAVLNLSTEAAGIGSPSTLPTAVGHTPEFGTPSHPRQEDPSPPHTSHGSATCPRGHDAGLRVQLGASAPLTSFITHSHAKTPH